MKNIQLSQAEVDDLLDSLKALRMLLSEERAKHTAANLPERAETVLKREARLHRLQGKLMML
jgi:hypothetical protein